MDNRDEVREFLVSRRAKVNPDEAGLPSRGTRRVPGLRRSEIATLAGISVEYYAKIERGALGSASPAVIDGLARALQLDDAERAHLLHLADAAGGTRRRPARRRSPRSTTRKSLQWALDAVTAGRDPHDRDLHDLVGELSTRSEEFRTRWASHDVRHHGSGTKRFHHPVVGDLTLAYEGLDMEAEPGLTLTIYTAEPGSPPRTNFGSWHRGTSRPTPPTRVRAPARLNHTPTVRDRPPFTTSTNNPQL